MRKFILSIVAFLFILSAGGVSVNMHYCMGKIIGTSIDIISAKNDSHCKTCGMKKKSNTGKDCCHDSKKLIKNSFDQKTTEAYSKITHKFFVNPFFCSSTINTNFCTAIKNNSRYNHAPPVFRSRAIYITNCTFLV